MYLFFFIKIFYIIIIFYNIEKVNNYKSSCNLLIKNNKLIRKSSFHHPKKCSSNINNNVHKLLCTENKKQGKNRKTKKKNIYIYKKKNKKCRDIKWELIKKTCLTFIPASKINNNMLFNKHNDNNKKKTDHLKDNKIYNVIEKKYFYNQHDSYDELNSSEIYQIRKQILNSHKNKLKHIFEKHITNKICNHNINKYNSFTYIYSMNKIHKQIDRLYNIYAKWNAINKQNKSTQKNRIKKLPKLFGIPIVLKDNIITKGIPTKAGSKILLKYIPTYDSTVVKKLKKYGAVIIGKTHMDEFAMGSCTNKSKNPFNETILSCGGSSGGSATCVGSRIFNCSINTDTGGSIRTPAALCGCIGFKPSYGRISRYGIIPYNEETDVVGFIVNNVFDCSILLDALCGKDDRDITTIHIEDMAENEMEYGKEDHKKDDDNIRNNIKCDDQNKDDDNIRNNIKCDDNIKNNIKCDDNIRNNIKCDDQNKDDDNIKNNIKCDDNIRNNIKCDDHKCGKGKMKFFSLLKKYYYSNTFQSSTPLKNITFGYINENNLKEYFVDNIINKNYIYVIESMKKLGSSFKQIELPNLIDYCYLYYLYSMTIANSNLSRINGINYNMHNINKESNFIKNVRSNLIDDHVLSRIISGSIISSYFQNKKNDITYIFYIMKQYLIYTLKEIFKKGVNYILLPSLPRSNNLKDNDHNNTNYSNEHLLKKNIIYEHKISTNDIDNYKDNIIINNTTHGYNKYMKEIFSVISSISGFPSMVIPVGTFTKKFNEPLSFQIIGDNLNELGLLKVALAYKQHMQVNKKLYENLKIHQKGR
ncbi:glutamyl-tRNA(Gln) amidotransferase subunit A, putative [Plasmodium reichenowi]|uniref:Glutamyl-tRNA(Gln) amidotransferase subunit A, putative n=1 Tax=Plasmodium reichenowi TaxID=5854 RepID=A0A2P9D5Y9_PLARE|nr:glutamyl-tRNA(Gln) amidotransferase subunit A, putative [Plasmodium reichenowi]